MTAPKKTRSNSPPSAPKVLSVFAGAGGLDLGLEAAGFEHIGLIEKEGVCRETLSLNRPKWPHGQWDDVHEAALKCKPRQFNLKRGELDLLAGAPPCQPYSTAAQWSSTSRRGFEDERASTLSSFLDLATSFRPKVVLMENVPSFWNSTVGTEEIVRGFFDGLSTKKSHYRVEARILNAADYGVPQVRKRAIIVAWRTDAEFEWPEANFAAAPRNCWDALSEIESSELPEAKGKWADLLPSIPEGWNYLWHTKKGEGRELFGYRTKFWSFLLKLSKDRPAWTLAAQPGPSTGPFHWDNRPLAIEEMLALQTFPTQWKFVGAAREQVKMIGNATPPLLSEVLGRSIRQSLLGHVIRRKVRYLPSKANCRPTLSTVSKVPEKYLCLEQDYPAHPGKGKGPNPRLSQNDLR